MSQWVRVPDGGASPQRGGALAIRDPGFFRGNQKPGPRVCNAALRAASRAGNATAVPPMSQWVRVPDGGASPRRGGVLAIRDPGFFRGSREPGPRVCNAALRAASRAGNATADASMMPRTHADGGEYRPVPRSLPGLTRQSILLR